MNVTLDECFQFGLGAFETIGIEQGIPILLDKHLKRLERAADFLKLGSLSERGITARKIEKYLEEIGAKPEEIEESLDVMVENIDIHMLELMINAYAEKKSVYKKKENELDQEIQHNLQKCERHPVVFRLYRMNKKQGQGRDSMAMRGFEDIAEIVQENGESYLELKLKEMAAHSRANGEMMAGKLKTLKYEHNEVLEEARIENNIVKIPMEACRIHRWTGIGTMGIVPVTVTCSVGPMHMPESTALLYFWV